MLKLLVRTVAALAVAVGVIAVPQAASAATPPVGVDLIWFNVGQTLDDGGQNAKCLDQFANDIQRNFVSMETCSSSFPRLEGQRWYTNRPKAGVDQFLFRNERTDLCLAQRFVSGVASFEAQFENCTGVTAQLWVLSEQSNIVRITNVRSGQRLEYVGRKAFVLPANDALADQKWFYNRA